MKIEINTDSSLAVDKCRSSQNCAVGSYSYNSTLSIARFPLPDYTNLIVNSIHIWRNDMADYGRESVILRSAFSHMSGRYYGYDWSLCYLTTLFYQHGLWACSIEWDGKIRNLKISWQRRFICYDSMQTFRWILRFRNKNGKFWWWVCQTSAFIFAGYWRGGLFPYFLQSAVFLAFTNPCIVI